MKLIVLISGKLQSGKNTFADMLKEQLELNNIKVGQDSFAITLKNMCKESFKPLTNLLNGIFYHNSSNKHFLTTDENWYEEKNDITRMILQIVGTDIVRKINPNYWVDQFLERCINSDCQVILNTDVRFENEYDFPIYVPCLKIRVNRKMERIGDIHNHPSETSLDNINTWDYVIDNDSDLDALKQYAISICNKILDKNY